jgi:hypothetical protein
MPLMLMSKGTEYIFKTESSLPPDADPVFCRVCGVEIDNPSFDDIIRGICSDCTARRYKELFGEDEEDG